MTKAMFKSVAMNARQARACMKHNKRETVTESIKAVAHMVVAGNEEVVYKTYDGLMATVAMMSKAPHGNAKIFREAVLTLEARHGIEDLISLGMKINDELGYGQMYFFIHRDEGHICNRTGAFIENTHAHFGYTTLNFGTGRVFPHGRAEMSKLQRLVADELGMEPGKPVSKTKRIGYDHKQWRALKEVLDEKDDQITGLVDLVKFHRIELEQLTSESGYSHSMMMVPLEHYLTSVDVRHRLEPSFEQRKNYLKGELKTIAKVYWIVKDLISAVDDQSSHTRMEILANHLQDANEPALIDSDGPSLVGSSMMGKWDKYKPSNGFKSSDARALNAEINAPAPSQN